MYDMERYLTSSDGDTLKKWIGTRFKNALLGAPNQGNREPPDMYVQSMSELRRYLAVLLQAWPAGFNLSVVKIKIRTIFQKILSETVFHETKLLELMRKAELHDVCKITKLNKGYLRLQKNCEFSSRLEIVTRREADPAHSDPTHILRSGFG